MAARVSDGRAGTKTYDVTGDSVVVGTIQGGQFLDVHTEYLAMLSSSRKPECLLVCLRFFSCWQREWCVPLHYGASVLLDLLACRLALRLCLSINTEEHFHRLDPNEAVHSEVGRGVGR